MFLINYLHIATLVISNIVTTQKNEEIAPADGNDKLYG